MESLLLRPPSRHCGLHGECRGTVWQNCGVSGKCSVTLLRGLMFTHSHFCWQTCRSIGNTHWVKLFWAKRCNSHMVFLLILLEQIGSKTRVEVLPAAATPPQRHHPWLHCGADAVFRLLAHTNLWRSLAASKSKYIPTERASHRESARALGSVRADMCSAYLLPSLLVCFCPSAANRWGDLCVGSRSFELRPRPPVESGVIKKHPNLIVGPHSPYDFATTLSSRKMNGAQRRASHPREAGSPPTR